LLGALSEQGVELQDNVEAKRLDKSQTKHWKHRQLLAAEDFLKLGKASRNVDVLNYYLYRGPTDAEKKAKGNAHLFDSALLDGDGAPPTDRRPAYCYLVLNHHGCPAKAATNGPVTDETSSSATAVLGTIEPNGLPTSYQVEWGTTPTYGHVTSAVETTETEGAESVTVNFSGLSPCTTYHYQVVAENEANESTPSLGGDQTVTTAGECAGTIAISTDNVSLYAPTGHRRSVYIPAASTPLSDYVAGYQFPSPERIANVRAEEEFSHLPTPYQPFLVERIEALSRPILGKVVEAAFVSGDAPELVTVEAGHILVEWAPDSALPKEAVLEWRSTGL
jgi:hypothetical protein